MGELFASIFTLLHAFSASFTRQTIDTPLPAIFAALWIECPPFNKRTMAHNT